MTPDEIDSPANTAADDSEEFYFDLETVVKALDIESLEALKIRVEQELKDRQ